MSLVPRPGRPLGHVEAAAQERAAEARALADRPLRLALGRQDHDTALRLLDGVCHAAVGDLRAPGLEHDDLMQHARLGCQRALQRYEGDRHNMRHLVGYVMIVARRDVVSAVRSAYAERNRLDAQAVSMDAVHDRLSPEKMDWAGRHTLRSEGVANTGTVQTGRLRADPEDSALQAEELRDIAATLRSLPDRQAEMLVATAVDGEARAVVAARFGVECSTVTNLASMARSALRAARELGEAA